MSFAKSQAARDEQAMGEALVLSERFKKYVYATAHISAENPQAGSAIVSGGSSRFLSFLKLYSAPSSGVPVLVRFVRKVDLMIVECLLALGQEACEAAMSDFRAERRQGLFSVFGQMLKTDPNQEATNPNTPEQSLRCAELHT